MNVLRRIGLGSLFLAVAGCTHSEPAVDPAVVAAHRERLLLTEEPDGAVGVVEVREMLAGPAPAGETPSGTSDGESGQVKTAEEAAPDATAPQSVVVVGRIGGIPNPWKQGQPDYPWSAGKAQFVIADAAAAAEIDEHGHAHDDPDHDCPFCAAAANSDVVAVVRFHDEKGKVIPLDARKLFDVKGEETIVVRGQAQFVGDAKDGVLVVDADGLYVRR